MSRIFTNTEHNIELLCSAVANMYLPKVKEDKSDTDSVNVGSIDTDDTATDSKTVFDAETHVVNPLILPGYTTYLTVAPTMSSDLFHKWISVTNKNAPSAMMIYHSTHIPAIAKLTSDESSVIRVLTDAFWTDDEMDELAIMMPPNEDIHPIFRQTNGKIIVEYSNHPTLRRLQEYTQCPLAVQTVYCNGIPCTAYEHFEDKVRDAQVLVLKDENPCKRGIESTLIDVCVDTKTVRIIRPGHITPSDILEVLHDGGYTDYQVIVCYEHASRYIRVVKPQWNKRIYRVKWASLDIFNINPDDRAYKELVHNTHAYLDKCVFLDYGMMHPEFATVCWGYVDLNQHRDIHAVLHTIYDILHQLSRMDSSHPILIYDLFSALLSGSDADSASELYLTLQQKIWDIEVAHDAMCIPFECVCDILGRKTIHVQRSNEVEDAERAEDMEMVD